LAKIRQELGQHKLVTIVAILRDRDTSLPFSMIKLGRFPEKESKPFSAEEIFIRPIPVHGHLDSNENVSCKSATKRR
jgi:hypothetical protein